MSLVDQPDREFSGKMKPAQKGTSPEGNHMATTIVETLGTVRPDGTLELDQKVTVPPGRVKVRVESVEPPLPPQETLIEFGDRSRRELEAAGHKFRTKEEIDAEIEELRHEWDDRWADLEGGGESATGKEKPG